MIDNSSGFPMPDTFRLEPALRPYVDTKLFRDSMAFQATTACLVATQLGAERLGRTVTAVLSLSVEPPTVLISIDIASRLADHIVKTQGFSFSILADGQQAIADAFAGRTEPEKRFDNGVWQCWRSGHPRLAGAVATMDCAVLGAIETGTHVLFAGGVVDIALVSERKPLIWHERRYKSLAETAPSIADVLTFPNTLKAESNQ